MILFQLCIFRKKGHFLELFFHQNHFTASGSPVDLILPKFGESVDAIKDFENKVFGIR